MREQQGDYPDSEKKPKRVDLDKVPPKSSEGKRRAGPLIKGPLCGAMIRELSLKDILNLQCLFKFTRSLPRPRLDANWRGREVNRLREEKLKKIGIRRDPNQLIRFANN
jgi:hypothetical protein